MRHPVIAMAQTQRCIISLAGCVQAHVMCLRSSQKYSFETPWKEKGWEIHQPHSLPIPSD